MKIKRNVKDSVFTHLFSIPKYRRELYVSLHPEDANILENELESITLNNVFTLGDYNDLGVLVRKKLIILVEAQSTWTENILWRILFYLSSTYLNLWEKDKLNIYGTKKVYLPLPELYVVYTGQKEIKKEVISLKEEFFNGEDCPIDIKIKILKQDAYNIMSQKTVVKSVENGIIKEYIEFTQVFEKNRLLNITRKECIEKTIEECIVKGVLKEYLSEHKMEVVSMMDILFDEDFAKECFGKEKYAEGIAVGKAEGIAVGKAEGIAVGKAEGETLAFIKLYKNNLIKSIDAAKMLNITEEEFLNKIKRLNINSKL